MEVTTEHQKWPQISTNSVKSPFFVRRAKKTLAIGRSPSQELEVSQHSGLYLLVCCGSRKRAELLVWFVGQL